MTNGLYLLTRKYAYVGFNCSRTVIIHAGIDDLGKGGAKDSLLTGNAGARVACGVIGM